VLRDFLGDARHFYWAPCKYVLVASEEVDELTFLFMVQTSPNLHDFDRVSSGALKAPDVGGMPRPILTESPRVL
jgi:hypothetical protein